MNDPRWTTVDGLLEAALEQPPHQRTAFLRDARVDEVLRRQMESLLGHSDVEGSFLDAPALELAVQAPGEGTESFVGRRFGSHRVLGLLDAGGMGEVYRAHDAALDRDVALKIGRRVAILNGGRTS